MTAVSETRQFRADPSGSRSRLTLLREQITKTVGLTSSGLIMLGLAVGFWVLARFVAGRPLYLISYLFFLVIIISYLVGRRPLPLEGSRSDARPRLQEGETVNMEVTLTATRRLSTFILEEQLPSALGDNARVPVATLDAGESVGHAYKLTCYRRGVYNLGPLVAKWGDPFGLTQRET